MKRWLLTALATAKMRILIFWKSTKVPTYRQWFVYMHDAACFERLIYKLIDDLLKVEETWGHFLKQWDYYWNGDALVLSGADSVERAHFHLMWGGTFFCTVLYLLQPTTTLRDGQWFCLMFVVYLHGCDG